MLQMARTRKPADERKSKSLIIRVSEDQKEILVAAANREGMDVSTWLRALGLRAAAQLGLYPGAKRD